MGCVPYINSVCFLLFLSIILLLLCLIVVNKYACTIDTYEFIC